MNINFTPFPKLTTERLELRRLTLADDNEIYFQRSDRSMNQFVDNKLCASIEEARAWIEMIEKNIVNNESIFWGVCIKCEEKIMGGFCFWNISVEEEKGEIGFGIFPAHQGKGFMNEVLQVALKYGFDVLGFKRIEGYTHPQNMASIRVMEKNGFRLKEEQPEDADPYVVYELLKPI